MCNDYELLANSIEQLLSFLAVLQHVLEVDAADLFSRKLALAVLRSLGYTARTHADAQTIECAPSSMRSLPQMPS